MLKRISFFGIALFVLGLASCETDFSLNGDYEIKPVIFGLLDHNDSIHKIKITKAYLGDGDNLVYAKIADSSYFQQVDARVIEYDGNEPTGREWQLKDSLITNKSTEGIFYSPDQRIYYFEEKTLDPEMSYELVADLNEGAHSINSKTELISGFSMITGLTSPFYKVRFAKNNVDENKDYISPSIDAIEGLYALEYELDYTFHWTEEYTDGSTASFSKRRDERKYTQKNPESPGTLNGRIDGIEFYRWVEAIIPEDPNVVRRKADGLDIHISIAHRDLAQFMAVSQPVSGIAQIKPEFTNINGGFGIFSSRILYTASNLSFDAASMKELASGQFTWMKLFCSEFPEHSEETYACP